jgi:hypothetical protein
MAFSHLSRGNAFALVCRFSLGAFEDMCPACGGWCDLPVSEDVISASFPALATLERRLS